MISIRIILVNGNNAIALRFKARHIYRALLAFTVLFNGGIVLTTGWCTTWTSSIHVRRCCYRAAFWCGT